MIRIRPAVGNERFERFRRLVLVDQALQAELRRITSRDRFVARAVEAAGERGIRLLPADVDEALRESRREWLERWI